MKTFGIIGTAALFLVLGSNAPAFAQEHQEQAKPEQHEEQAKPAKPAEQEAPAKQEAPPKTARQETAAKPAQERTQAKAATQPKQAKPEQRQEQAKAIKPETQNTQEARSGPAAQERRSPVEEQTQRSAPPLRLSARNNSRIPEDRFSSNFGQAHEFRIGTPRMVGGYSRFQYGGYWFGFVQPWPVGWYYTDDVYVDYIDGGYFLCNPSYPGVRIAISVVG